VLQKDPQLTHYWIIPKIELQLDDTVFIFLCSFHHSFIMRLIFLSSLFGFANCQYYKMTFDEKAHRSRSSIQPWTIDNGNGCVLNLHFWKSDLFGPEQFAAARLQEHVGETTASLIKETDVNPCIDPTGEKFHKNELPSEYLGDTCGGKFDDVLSCSFSLTNGLKAFEFDEYIIKNIVKLFFTNCTHDFLSLNQFNKSTKNAIR
jgi:hypothetical protein